MERATPIKVRAGAHAPAHAPGLAADGAWRGALQPRTSISFGEADAEAVEAGGTTPGSGFRPSIHIVPGGAHDTWSGFADTPTSSAATKFHASFRSMGVKARRAR